MAIGWLTVLQAVPWGQVLDNAPKIAQGARKLWGSVSGKADAADVSGADARQFSAGDANSDMAARLAQLEKTTIELHDQMMTSTALIKELAEQNTQLIKHIEVNRVRTFWLAVLGSIATLAAVVSLILVLMPSAS